MNGFEYLKTLSDEQLADAGIFFADLDDKASLIKDHCCPDMLLNVCPGGYCDKTCEQCVSDWLATEVHSYV